MRHVVLVCVTGIRNKTIKKNRKTKTFLTASTAITRYKLLSIENQITASKVWLNLLKTLSASSKVK